MSKEIVNKYDRVDKIFIKAIISLFILLIITQWYLKIENRGSEAFLNKLYSHEGLSFKVIDIIP